MDRTLGVVVPWLCLWWNRSEGLLDMNRKWESFIYVFGGRGLLDFPGLVRGTRTGDVMY